MAGGEQGTAQDRKVKKSEVRMTGSTAQVQGGGKSQSQTPCV